MNFPLMACKVCGSTQLVNRPDGEVRCLVCCFIGEEEDFFTTQTSGVVGSGSDTESLKQRIEDLEKAFRACHEVHMYPRMCAVSVDRYFHKLFPDEYDPYKDQEDGE